MNTWEFLKETYKRWTTKEAPARDPKKIRVKKLGQAIQSGGGGNFEDPTVDLEEISRAYHTDSYIKRAVDKYSDLMFKNGWDISSKNDKASEYVWTRLKLMTEATGVPIEQLFYQIAYDLVLFGNAYVIKARQKGSSPGTGVNAQGYTGKQPIAGYFVLAPTSIMISRDENGTVLGYQQSVGGGSALDIKPEDMIHFTYKRPSGRAYGIPFVYNVLDDVKMLRQIEENVARLVYRNLFPLYLYQVGLDKPGFEATDEEIDEIREAIRDMPMDGGIVLPERHNIKVVGTEGAALDAEPYLKYFRQRVFTGLGVSDSIMGVGDTSNRSTSDNQSADLNDGVKEFQRVMADIVQFHMVNEILFEGGFDPILNPDDEVLFAFHEIELDAKIKKENHVIQLFMQNAITHEEMRSLIGLDPVADEGRLMFNMITGALAAQAAAESAANQGNNQDQPENQHGKQTSPGKTKRESGDKKQPISEKVEENSSNVLTEEHVMVTLTQELAINSYFESMKLYWNNLRDDVVQMIKNGKSESEVRGFATELVRQSLRYQSRQYIHQAMIKGMESAQKELDKPVSKSMSTAFAIENIIGKSTKYVDRLINDIDKLISTAYVEEVRAERVVKIIGAFNSNEYRLSFIAKTELYRAFNYGKVVVAKEAGLEKVFLTHEHGGKCSVMVESELVLTGTDLLEAVPPLHPNCHVLVQLNMPAEEV